MSDPSCREDSRSILDVLQLIRQGPGFFLDGDRSLKRLRSFLVGYQCGLARGHLVLCSHDSFKDFDGFVAKELGFAESTSGWCNMILEKAGSDETGYELFYKLLDKFSREKGIQN